MRSRHPYAVAALSLVLAACSSDSLAPVGTPDALVVPSLGDPRPCLYFTPMEFGFHTISAEDCTVRFENETVDYAIHYNFSLHGEPPNTTAVYAVVVWTVGPNGSPSYSLAAAMHHTHTQSPDTGTVPMASVQFPTLARGVAITGYSVVCHDSFATRPPEDCWNNRHFSHPDARWEIGHPTREWAATLDDEWMRLIPIPNDVNASPSAHLEVSFSCITVVTLYCSYEVDPRGSVDTDGTINMIQIDEYDVDCEIRGSAQRAFDAIFYRTLPLFARITVFDDRGGIDQANLDGLVGC